MQIVIICISSSSSGSGSNSSGSSILSSLIFVNKFPYANFSLSTQHDGLTKQQGWFLEQVEIVKKVLKTGKEKVWVFQCQQWLSLHEGDCQISRELFAKISSKTG